MALNGFCFGKVLADDADLFAPLEVADRFLAAEFEQFFLQIIDLLVEFGGVVGKYFLTVFRIVLFGVLCWWISSLLKREKPVPTGVLVGLTLITAGAFGNIVDCLFYGLIWDYAPLMQGKVVDMLYFPLWTWPDWVPLVGGDIFFEPVFNFADSCVTVGAIYLILFQWKFFAKE